MSQELGKIEKPSVEEYRKGRKLFLVPLIFHPRDGEPELLEKIEKYWTQVDNQLGDLESKLGKVTRVYHELITEAGESGAGALKELNEKSARIIENRVSKGATLEATEDHDILTEFLDWSRCLSIGLENPGVFNKVYEAYREAGRKRNEHIARRIDETLKDDETGVLIIREGHQVQFPTDIQIFYVSPPALDEMQRWLRDRREKPPETPGPEEGPATPEKGAEGPEPAK